MLFTSITFAIFFLIVFFLYWFVFNRSVKIQNIFLLVSSYIFYGWWDWRFLFLLLFISLSNYLIGIGIKKDGQKQNRKLLFITALVINTGTLVLFKYFNFFIDSFISLISVFGFHINPLTLNIILPLGISFYIFISLSYIIDIYQYRFIAVRNIYDAMLTFSFFPIILAGPIQRPISLLPQIQNKRIFNYNKATDGLRQILWGVFMKIVIADNCAAIVKMIFANSTAYSGSTLLFGIFLFTVQIYADFAGYSNIAIGVGKMLGFNIMQNFAYPYFARDIREFWQRWNISVTTWFRDYIFLPIAYSFTRNIKSNRFYFVKVDLLIYTVGISVTWILSGLWHGANYTFIIWGLLQGVFLLINHVSVKSRRRILKRLNIRNDNILLVIADSLTTFTIIMFSWIFFRADNIGQAFNYISKIFSMSLFTLPEIKANTTIIYIIIFFLAEWLGRDREYAIAGFSIKLPGVIRWVLYYCIILSILYYTGSDQQFIYFKF